MAILRDIETTLTVFQAITLLWVAAIFRKGLSRPFRMEIVGCIHQYCRLVDDNWMEVDVEELESAFEDDY